MGGIPTTLSSSTSMDSLYYFSCTFTKVYPITFSENAHLGMHTDDIFGVSAQHANIFGEHAVDLALHITGNQLLVLHLKLLIPSLHVAPFLHGLLRHSSMFFSHKAPVNPEGHLQWKLPILSSQIALLRHGFERHSFTSVSQWEPV